MNALKHYTGYYTVVDNQLFTKKLSNLDHVLGKKWHICSKL